MEQVLFTNKEIGANKTPRTTMIDEQVLVVWECDVFLGQTEPPNGYVNYRYSDGRDYSGYMRDGRPHGYGLLRGKILSYIGVFEDGYMTEGIMVDTVRGTEFHIPWTPPAQPEQGAPDPQ
jgi:hypothetical protein